MQASSRSRIFQTASLVVVSTLVLCRCSSLTAPSTDPEPELVANPGNAAALAVAPSPSQPPTPAPPPPPLPPPPPPPAPPSAADADRVGASHLLVSYKGAAGSIGGITRSKNEARKRAEQALAKAKKGVPFEQLVKEYSDEPGAAARGGSLGVFPREAMVKPFADAAFALKPGGISGVVETQFGFHVIKRTQ